MELKAATNLTDLAWIFGCTAKQLGYYVYKRSEHSQYKRFEITKKRGGTRIIHAPHTNLKIIQRNISRELEALRTFKPCVNGFVAGRDIRRNAHPHVGQRFVLNVDLEDFFGSINFGRVFGLLSKPPFEFHRTIAAAIAKACTFDNRLPQGAPSSPILSNLICSRLDADLTRLAAANKCIYTRYADDLTFSTQATSMPLATTMRQADGTSFDEASIALRNIIERNGFTINTAKVRLSTHRHRQEVTGLIVNRRVNVKRRAVREARAMLHAWKKFGLAAAQTEFSTVHGGGALDFERVLRGKIGFIGQIRGRPDEIFRKLANDFNSLAVGPKIRTELTALESALRAVWVIEDTDGNQGTAFFLEKHGLVTCSHCLGPGLHIYHSSDHTKKYPITVTKNDTHRDLAILSTPPALPGIVPIPLYEGPTPPNGTAVQLLGYPAHHAARPIRMEGGTIIRAFPRSGVSYLEITPKIIGGNSGGPLVSEKLEVVGVAVLGLNGKVDLKSTEFLAVSVRELDGL